MKMKSKNKKAITVAVIAFYFYRKKLWFRFVKTFHSFISHYRL